MRRPAIMAIAACLLSGCVTPAQDVLINGFEDQAELSQWEITAGGQALVNEGVTQGDTALELTFDPNGQWDAAHLFWNRVVQDWSAHDALVVDILNPNDFPVRASLLIGDQAWQDKNASYWNRHNSSITFAPGAGRWVVPTRGIYRGEAGSRNNDIKTDIDPSQIIRLDFGFGGKGETGRIIVDNIRFVTIDRPESVWAFDFGPPSQPVMLGWTAASNQTAHDAQVGYGWTPANNTPWDGAARDNTFGTMLTQDFCAANGYSFRVDVPAGDYECLVIYENCGYWGGEQAKNADRRILANGELAWSEIRPDGRSTALFRFEDIEPINVDIWDTYMAEELARPMRFQATAGETGLTLQFESDVTWGSKLSAVALHRVDDDEATKWLAGQLEAVADEFRAKAVCLDPTPEPIGISDAWAEKKLVAWPVGIEDEIGPYSTPNAPADPDAIAIECDLAKGEVELLGLAIRPQADLGECGFHVEVEGQRAPMPVGVVRYSTSRGFGSIAYSTRPHTVRMTETVEMPADVTRVVVVPLATDADTPAGETIADLVMTSPGGDELLRAPLTIRVHDVALDRETDYIMGYFGLMPPASLLPEGTSADALENTLRLLQSHGANGVSGGPSWRITGWQLGVPQIDFGTCDEFFALLKQYGFDKAINGYGGLRFQGLHDRYTKGATGAKVEEDSGLDYEAAVMRAWEVVDAHARENDWPVIYYAMCDETRVREQAEEELAFMRIMDKVCERFPETVKPSGSYSVNFDSRPTDEDDMLLWHQRFFGALAVSSLNNHSPLVMAEAEQLGREVHIYNQGRTRYSFGLYQWSEHAKGVTARWQWHLNVLHGYQFFDLDGREPDTSMICYGRDDIYPTVHFERCREGAEDFYLLNALSKTIAANRDANRKPTETDRAEQWLTDLTDSVALNQRTPPAGYDANEMKLEAIRMIEAIR
ncbi:MAG TPA: hypothetical protein QGH10_27440 [Armatimonadota bacterium]|nr:hypothetical protein [Armatimonadota bacterium]